MRGKADSSAQAEESSRITPAYAGKRPFAAAETASPEDHPRLCGEKLSRFPAKVSEMGSPPPMRGKAGRCAASVPNWRITPAYAGKSGGIYHEKDRCKDHPRLCGEKGQKRFFRGGCLGSPPPMRGKAYVGGDSHLMTGITPAYAGKSHCFAVPRVDVKDHPRLCGEKMVRCFKCGNSPGSPPPMRGKVAQFYFSQIVYRITPAYAGKSFRHLSSATIQQDHPRLCGEKLHMPEKFVWRLGSPPPMRGKVPILVAAEPRTRITPAYAGKRGSDCFWFCCIWDHPRLCGEKVCRKWI